ncbi:MAG TPA: sensor histidine kinase [Firmicutes bacterium]|nr:sensor histidine kinase [Bacillota bacterium]
MKYENGEKSTVWRRNLLALFAVYAFVIFLVSCLFVWIFHVTLLNKFAVTGAFLLLFLLIFVAIYLHFVKHVFHPVSTIEKAVRILLRGETEQFLAQNPAADQDPGARAVREMLADLRNAVNKQYSAEILKRQAEFSALQSQINPHFLYNTLEAIRGQALVEGIDEIAEMTEALSTLFRYSISRKGDLITLEEELSNVESYFVIQQYRFHNKFTFSIKYDETEPEILDCIIPKLTLQPIVENAVYHGLEPKIGTGKITIRITATEKRLIIRVSDDGVGMDQETLDLLNYRISKGLNWEQEQEQLPGQRHMGIALVNVNLRIRLLFGDLYGLSVSSTKGFGTEVEIVLPLVKEMDDTGGQQAGMPYEN